MVVVVALQDQLVDVTLLCDGGSYPAHRLVLAACSPYFHQLFTRLPTQHPLIYLRDVKQAELEALLEFIYRGEVSLPVDIKNEKLLYTMILF